MTNSIEAFLNSDVGKKAKAKAIRAIDLVDHRSATSMDDLLLKIADAGVRAFLSSLAEQGAMREACVVRRQGGAGEWIASEGPIYGDGKPAFILRRE